MYKNEKLYLELKMYLWEKYGEDNVMCKPKEAVYCHIYPDCPRRFRYDFYLIKENIAIEVNGGQFMSKNGGAGRHNRGGKGYEEDLTKLNIAQKHNTKVYQFTYQMLSRLEYKDFI